MENLKQIENCKSTAKILIILSFIVIIIGMIINNQSFIVISWGTTFYAFELQKKVIKFYEKKKT